MILSIILAAGLNYGATPPSPDSQLGTDYGYYFENSSYHIVNFVHNAYGEPYQGAAYSIQVNGHNYSAVSDRAGYANITIPESSTIGVSSLDELHNVGTSSFPYSVPINSSNPIFLAGENLYNVSYVITGVYNPNNPRLNNVLIYYLGENGNPSPNVNIYWSSNYETISSGSSNSSSVNSTLIKTVGGFRNIIITPNIPYRSGVYANQKEFFITVTGDRNSGFIQTTAVSLVQEISPSTAYEFIFSELGSTFQIFVPLIAIVSSYQLYAFDRINGVIESVLVRPVKASQVLAIRYLSNSISLVIPIMAAVEILNLFSIVDLGVSIPPSMVALIIWAFVIESLAFIGIIFMLSHITRNNIRVIGLSIFLYFVFNVLWTFFGQVIGNGNPLNYLSPGGYFLQVKYYVFEKLFPTTAVVILHQNFNWSAYLGLLFLCGILWVIIPFITSLILSKYRD